MAGNSNDFKIWRRANKILHYLHCTGGIGTSQLVEPEPGMCEASGSSLSGAQILKISSCFNDACSKKNSKRQANCRNTNSSLSSEETVFSSDPASARSSRTSSGYSGVSSLCECFEVNGTPVLSKHRERGSVSKLFSETDVPDSSEKENCVFVSQPSLKMIRRLKRLSDAWSNISRCTDEVIIDRLKKGREEAMRKQTYIEVKGSWYLYEAQL